MLGSLWLPNIDYRHVLLILIYDINYVSIYSGRFVALFGILLFITQLCCPHHAFVQNSNLLKNA